MSPVSKATITRLMVWAILAVLFFRCEKSLRHSLVVHVLAEPEGLHPTNGNSALQTELNLYLHLSLLRLDYQTGELMPCLVKRLPTFSADGLSYDYELKEGITWDDQSEITADDVAFTIKASKCVLTDNPSQKSSWTVVHDVILDPKNNKRFTIKMNQTSLENLWFWRDVPIIQQAYYDKQQVLTKYSCYQLSDSLFVSSKKDIATWAKEFNSPKYYSDIHCMSGSGPYKISEWDKGMSFTLEKKPHHWTSNCNDKIYCQAYPKKIIFKINTNNASTLLELKNGLIDVSTMVDVSSFIELSKDPSFTQHYTTKLADTYNYMYVAMNMKPDGKKHHKLFDDVLVRKAMALLTPYDQINRIIFENSNKRISGPVSPLKPECDTTLVPIHYNTKEASSLLEQAGWKDSDNDQVLDKIIDGKKINLEFDINFLSTQKQWESIAKQLTESMQKAKVYAKLNPMDYRMFLSSAMNHDFDMSIGAWQSTALPEDFSQLWHSSSWKNHGLNFTGFGDQQSDSLIDSMNRCMNKHQRYLLSKKFQKRIYNEQPYIFLFTQKRRVIVHKTWGNLTTYTEHPGVLLNTLKLKE